MITNTIERNVEKIGEFGAESEFQIKNTAKAFRMIVGNLYSDKVAAIVRELSANGFDAHVASGHSQPFEVTLPTHFEPTFAVRDFGPSMPHEFMMNEYTMAFYSSKDTSNDFVGAMGLGRLRS